MIIRMAQIANPDMSDQDRQTLATIAALMKDEDDEVHGPILWDEAQAVGMVETKNGDAFPGVIGVQVEGAIGVKPTRLRISCPRTIDIRGTSDLQKLESFFGRIKETAAEAYEEAKKRPVLAEAAPEKKEESE